MVAISQAMAWFDEAVTDTGLLAFLVFVVVTATVRGRRP